MGLIERLQSRFGDAILDSHARLGDETVIVRREVMPELFRHLRDDPETAFEMLADMTAVDYLGRAPRFELVCHLLSLSKRHRLRVKVPIDEADCHVPTSSSLWKSANWLEREIWDLYGIRFDGHPDLRRILMYPSFEGHPLRKDYPVAGRQPIIPERDPIENPWPSRDEGLRR
ncbi:MAG: NADH-quinone oxidoreductase subunit C [Candidatus Binatia bacterium]